jgi:molybdopterin converting factor small subunit
MPTVLLFASIAEAAGTRSMVFEASTLGALLEAARAAWGPAFAEQLGHCRIVVNGETVEAGAIEGRPIAETDEIAILPPVAGG